MTIKELYEWAIDKNVENFDLEVDLEYGAYKSVYEDDLYIDRLYDKVAIDTEWF